MENKEELKNKMKQFLNQVDQMKDSIGAKNAEIEMFENEVATLEGEKLQYETYSYDWPELAEEKQAEIEKTKETLKELYEEKEKEDEVTKEKLAKVEKPVEEINGILAEIEMFEDEKNTLEYEKQTLAVYSYNEPELAEEKQAEIEKTEKMLDELYEKLAQYGDLKIDFANSAKEVNLKENSEKSKSEKEEKAEDSVKAPSPEQLYSAGREYYKNATKDRTKEPVETEPTKEPTKEPAGAKPTKKEETSLAKPSRWDKFKEGCKGIWDKIKDGSKKAWKVVVATAVAIVPALGPTAKTIEETTKTGVKTHQIAETKEVTRDATINDVKEGQVFTVDKDVVYYEISGKQGREGKVGENITYGQNAEFIISKIVRDQNGQIQDIHYSVYQDDKTDSSKYQPGMLNVDSEVIQKEGATGDLVGKEANIGTDAGWQPDLEGFTITEEKTVWKTVEEPYEYTVKEEKIIPIVDDVKKQPENIELPPHDEPKTQEPYKEDRYKQVKDLEEGKTTTILGEDGKEVEISLGKVESARAKFRESLRVDNKDSIDNILDNYDTKAIEEKMDKFKASRAKDEIKDDEKDNEER